MLERHSALAAALAAGGRDGADGHRELRLGELRGWSLVQIAAHAGGSDVVAQAIADLTGASAPPTIAGPVAAGAFLIMRTGARQFWVVDEEGGEHAAKLSAVVPAGAGAVTPLSHSRTRLFVEGAPARAVLSKGAAIDFHPKAFPVGALAMTGIHHTPVLIRRSDADRYEIWAMRTYAQAVWEWLTDAALEYGYDIAR
jgi:sarcosine oxidase subunit gamma